MITSYSMRINVALLGSSLLALSVAAGCKGATGDPGDQGPQGPRGEPGVLDPGLSSRDKALAGMGGQVAITGMVGFEFEATGGRSVVSQSLSPYDPAVEASTFEVRVRYDLRNENVRLDYTRAFAAGPSRQLRYDLILEDRLGFITRSDSVFSPGSTGREMESTRLASILRAGSGAG